MLSTYDKNSETMLDIDARIAALDKDKSLRAFQNEAIEVYRALWQHFYHARPKLDYAKTVGVLKNISKLGFTNKQVVAMIFLHFEWRGFEGTNDNCWKDLYKRGFPLGYIYQRANFYSTYIVGTIGRDLWKDEVKLAAVVAKWETVLFASKVD